MRVVVGAFGDVVSPLEPREPFVLLEALLLTALDVPVADGANALVYVQSGAVDVSVDGGGVQAVRASEAVAVTGRGEVQLVPLEETRLLVAAGLAIDEPVVQVGPFIMSDAAGVKAAMRRYEAGELGGL